MGYRVEKTVEAKLNRYVFDLRKDKSLKEIQEDFNVYGIPISYKGFTSLVNGQSSWSLTYAIVLSRILNVSIDLLFTLEKTESGNNNG